MEPMSGEKRNLVSLGATLGAALLLPFLRIHPIYALVIGVGVYFLLRRIIPLKVSDEEQEYCPGCGVSVAYMKELQEFGEQAVIAVSRQARVITDKGVSELVWEISDILEKIFKNFADDPKDLHLSAVQTFLRTNLERAIRIIETYAQLQSEPMKNRQEEQERLAEAEKAIRVIRDGFTELLRHCREDNLKQLDMDSHVLSKMLTYTFPEIKEKEPRK